MEYSDKIVPRISTIADYRSRINRAMKFIQENSGKQLDIKTIANVANFSPFHFHRIFACIVGETLSDYIKKVRIKRAVSLLNSGYKIHDIASECGYLTTSAFSKVFRQTLAITPSKFRNIKESENREISLRSTYSRHSPSILIKPRIIDDSTHSLFYIRMKVNQEGLFNENIGQAFHTTFERWYQILESDGLSGNIKRRIGIFRNLDSINPEKSAYDAGMIFNKSVQFPFYKEVEVVEIKQGRWAVFLHEGPYNTLWQTWSWIFNRWCFVNNIQLRDADPYEVYLNKKSETLAEDLLTEIYIPIC